MTVFPRRRRHVLAACLVPLALHAGASPAMPAGDPDPRATIAAMQAVAPGGIGERKAIAIGGIPQWITLRGSDPRKPILLFLHGGPGAPMMPESWTFQRPWEDYFTVVQWDQRGAGKTYPASIGKPAQPLTIDLMVSDTIELVQYLRRTYGKRKIFLMGHSWGTVLGMEVARRRPDLLHAYIGVGQVVGMVRNEDAGYRLMLAEARRRRNAKALAQLEAIAPYPNRDGSLPLHKTAVARAWALALGGTLYGRSSGDGGGLRRLSPDYSANDLASAGKGEMHSVASLWPELSNVDFARVHALRCPLILFAGEHDMVTPPALVREFFDRVQAPYKRFVLVPKAAHYVVNEAPGLTLVALVQHALPLAGLEGMAGSESLRSAL